MTPIERLLDAVAWEDCEPPTEQTDLPYAIKTGMLKIMGLELPCAVLNTGERIFYGPEIEAMAEEALKLERKMQGER